MSDDSQFMDTKEYQLKVLSYMLHNHDFCNIAADALKEEMLSDKALQWYFDKLSSSSISLSPVTLKEELIKAAKAKHIRSDELDKYIEYFDLLKQRPAPIEEEYINKHLTRFIRRQAVKKALLESWDLAKSEQWDEIVESMQDAVTQGLDILEMGSFYFSRAQQRIANRLNEEILEKIPTGVPGLDDLMYGGLKAKQLGLIVGGTGRGKSIFLEWLAKVAILLGKKVVYYTCELSSEDIEDRFDSLFSQIKINELKSYNNDIFVRLNDLEKKFGDALVIKEYPADTATVHTLKGHLRQLASIGFIPDLVIVDYLDLLKPHRLYNSTHEELDAITKALHGMSKEFGTRIWTVTQLNRSGLAMETPDETSIAGAVAKLYTVDVAIFLGQTAEEREDQELRLLVAKNRNGPAGRSVKIDTDYARMTFYKGTVGGQDSNTNRSVDGQEESSEGTEGDSTGVEDTVIDELTGATTQGDVLVLS